MVLMIFKMKPEYTQTAYPPDFLLHPDSIPACTPLAGQIKVCGFADNLTYPTTQLCPLFETTEKQSNSLNVFSINCQ